LYFELSSQIATSCAGTDNLSRVTRRQKQLYTPAQKWTTKRLMIGKCRIVTKCTLSFSGCKRHNDRLSLCWVVCLCPCVGSCVCVLVLGRVFVSLLGRVFVSMCWVVCLCPCVGSCVCVPVLGRVFVCHGPLSPEINVIHLI